MQKTHAHPIVTSVKPTPKSKVYISAARTLFSGKHVIVAQAITSAEIRLGMRPTFHVYNVYSEIAEILEDFDAPFVRTLNQKEREEFRAWVLILAAAIADY